MRPKLDCCVPWSRQFPSGIRWLHARDCIAAPGRKVGDPPKFLRDLIEPAGYTDAHLDDDDDRLPTFQEVNGA